MVRTLLLFFLLFSPLLEAFSQSLEETLSKTMDLYNKDRYEMVIQHRLYSLTGDEALETQDIDILKDGKMFYMNSYGEERIRNNDYHVIVNHRTRVIFIVSLNAKMSDVDRQQREMIQSDMQQLISFMKDFHAENQGKEKQTISQYLGVKNKCHVYRATFRGGLYESADLYFDQKDGKVKKCEYFTRDAIEILPGVVEKAKLVILPKKFKVKGHIDKKKFSTDAFFRIGKDNNVVLTDQYKDYTPVVEL
ncbi:MAG: hypothetical protein IKX43_09825 [Paludibacteraceae bacterium]|nr:hypothetical protein [Paludibacteraceae bacterium]